MKRSGNTVRFSVWQLALLVGLFVVWQHGGSVWGWFLSKPVPPVNAAPPRLETEWQLEVAKDVGETKAMLKSLTAGFTDMSSRLHSLEEFIRTIAAPRAGVKNGEAEARAQAIH